MNRRPHHKVKRADASEVVRRKKSSLIIDGYNLMHVTRFKPVRTDNGELRRCREGLLALLAEHLPSSRYRDITVVFDATYAPSHLADRQQFRHLLVLFARDENTADDLIAKLVQQHTIAKQLVVISSDHRVQNAARRRKATPLDSDVWFDAVLDLAESPANEIDEPEAEPNSELTGEDLMKFVAEMKQEKPEVDEANGGDAEVEEFENPFPEGYFDGIDDELIDP